MKSTLSSDQRSVNNRFAALTAAKLSESEQQSVVTLALEVLQAHHQPGQSFDNPETTRKYLRLRLGGKEAEVFGCLFLDNYNRMLKDKELFQGTINGAPVYPRIVVQQALSVNAAAVILYHNHPAGVEEPSTADKAITQRLKEALALVDVRILDHFIVTCGSSFSFAEHGLL